MLGNRGFISVFSLILMSIILIFSLFLVNLSNLEYLITNASRDNIQAYHSGESKINLILNDEKYYKQLLEEIEKYLKHGNISKFRIIIDDKDLIGQNSKKNVEGTFLKEEELFLELKTTSSCNKIDCQLLSQIKIINNFYELGLPILSEKSVPVEKLDEYIKYIEKIEEEIEVSNKDNIIGIDGTNFEHINIILGAENQITFEFFVNNLADPLETKIVYNKNLFFIVKNKNLEPTNISILGETDLNERTLNGVFYIEGNLKIYNDMKIKGILISNNGLIEVDPSAELTVEGLILTKNYKGKEISKQNNIIVKYNEKMINTNGIYVPGFIDPKIEVIKINTNTGIY